MVHLAGLVPRELELPTDFFDTEGLGLFLRHADEDNPVPARPVFGASGGDIILPFLVVELVDRDLLPFRLDPHRLPEPLRPMYPFRYSRSRHATSIVTC